MLYKTIHLYYACIYICSTVLKRAFITYTTCSTKNFFNRFHIVGVLLIFIHDIGDVFLEGSKSILYFKEQNGKMVQWIETCANIGFVMFASE